ncbi:unnamed protein product [Paramecium sonneborni]|uniref:Uncharacterized protein n=1 Tax=Paramecium sonneborni TaxID=65129 RepID=A0A8S1RPJ5_9CILI|nr:unnamed protein product [Paramecium sonneborni]
MKFAILANYYPEWKDIKVINKNKTKTCVLDDKKIKTTSVKRFEKVENEMLNLKFDFINLLYEIHQMQKILQLITPSDLRLNIHLNQSKLLFQTDQDLNDFSIKQQFQQNIIV